MKTGSRSLTRAPMSAKLAVWPPTWACAGLPASTSGKHSGRSRSIVSQGRGVLRAGGRERRSASPRRRAGSTCTGADRRDARVGRAPRQRSGSTTPGSPETSTATTSGPLVPGPKPSATRS